MGGVLVSDAVGLEILCVSAENAGVHIHDSRQRRVGWDDTHL
jgi:hypothetical protein